MEKVVVVHFAGEARPLHFSVGSMLEVNEKYGGASEALDLMCKDDAEAFAVMQNLAVLMANDAELCRRAEGYDPKPMLEAKDLTTMMSPIEYLRLKQGISRAIELGYEQELGDENKETELGLLELQKKEEAGV